jgi:hypothetical protein
VQPNDGLKLQWQKRQMEGDFRLIRPFQATLCSGEQPDEEATLVKYCQCQD